MEFSIITLIRPLTDRFWNRIFHWWDDRQATCKKALRVVTNEKRNFEQLAHIRQRKRDFNGLDHKRAVAEKSFELTGNATDKLSRLMWIRHYRIRRIAREASRVCKQELSRPIDKRGATEILPLVKQLEKTLKNAADTASTDARDAAPF